MMRIHRRTLVRSALYLLVAGVSAPWLMTVAYASNNPIPGIDVVVQKQPGGSDLVGVTGMSTPPVEVRGATVFSTRTNKDGRFQLKGLPAGTYTMMFSDEGAAKATGGTGKLYGIVRITNVRGNANQFAIAWAMLPMDSGGKPMGPVTVNIPSDGGSITGVVVQSASLEDGNTAMSDISTTR